MPASSASSSGRRQVDGVTVSGLTMARWEQVQAEIRQLALLRGLRFVAVAILAPFGVSAVGRESPGRDLSFFVFGLTLLLLALAELSSMLQSGLQVRLRQDLEKSHPELRPQGTPGRWSRALSFTSGPGFSTALYALMGGAFLAGGFTLP